MSLSTPIGFFIFNRPELTQRVFARIARARPRSLLVVADGPRTERPDDETLITATRKIVEQVDWPCDLRTNFASENLGCRRRVSSGLDWVFEQVDEAIILEDDCLPDPTFFAYCHELLERYRNDRRVMAIGGTNFQEGREQTADSYYFSKYFHCWGWATWRRAWNLYDVEMGGWPEFRDSSALGAIADTSEEFAHWRHAFKRLHLGLVDTWDYQFTFAMWAAGALSIVPTMNLISNIGFGSDATHTKTPDHPWANRPTSRLEGWRHPESVQRCRPADMHTFKTVFAKRRRGMRKYWAQIRASLITIRYKYSPQSLLAANRGGQSMNVNF